MSGVDIILSLSELMIIARHGECRGPHRFRAMSPFGLNQSTVGYKGLLEIIKSAQRTTQSQFKNI